MQQYLYFIVSEAYLFRPFVKVHVIENKQHHEQAIVLFKRKLFTTCWFEGISLCNWVWMRKHIKLECVGFINGQCVQLCMCMYMWLIYIWGSCTPFFNLFYAWINKEDTRPMPNDNDGKRDECTHTVYLHPSLPIKPAEQFINIYHSLSILPHQDTHTKIHILDPPLKIIISMKLVLSSTID